MRPDAEASDPAQLCMAQHAARQKRFTAEATPAAAPSQTKEEQLSWLQRSLHQHKLPYSVPLLPHPPSLFLFQSHKRCLY